MPPPHGIMFLLNFLFCDALEDFNSMASSVHSLMRNKDVKEERNLILEIYIRSDCH